MFVLDTNVVSEMRKAGAGKANPGVAAWARSVPAALMFLSAISLHELEHGVLLAERRDPEQGALLRRWLDSSVAAAFADRILPVDERVARRAAALHVPDPAPFRDALIAATAQIHGMTVVTRNVSDFRRFAGLEVTNPWT
jgi:predicted nucleic acid-binding protein